jgi:hypothetical protein
MKTQLLERMAMFELSLLCPKIGSKPLAKRWMHSMH